MSIIIRRHRQIGLTAILIFLLIQVSSASAADPGRWQLISATPISPLYWQGVTSTPSQDLIFTGIAKGAYRTDSLLRQRAVNYNTIPNVVRGNEGFNHVGDPSYDQSQGGRVLLPLECYNSLTGANSCLRGAIGVIDPINLKWRYYSKVDGVDKLMWIEVSPDGQLAWTSSGNDLIAFATSSITKTNSGAGSNIEPARVISGALDSLPPVSGGAFWNNRLFVAGQSGKRFTIYSFNLADGSRRLEIERKISGESEGINSARFRNGLLQWQIMPRTNYLFPTYLRPTLLNFRPKA